MTVINFTEDEILDFLAKLDSLKSLLENGKISNEKTNKTPEEKGQIVERSLWNRFKDFISGRNQSNQQPGPSKQESDAGHAIYVTAANNSSPKEEHGRKSQQTPGNQVKLRVQILNPADTRSSRAFVDALKTFAAMTKKVEIHNANDINEWDHKTPLIVVCPNSSRLQPDVDLVVSPIKSKLGSSPCVVIVLHVGFESNLPALPSGQKLSGYDKITFVDMGFSNEGEIYQCRHNDKAVEQLISYVESFSSKREG